MHASLSRGTPHVTRIPTTPCIILHLPILPQHVELKDAWCAWAALRMQHSRVHGIRVTAALSKQAGAHTTYI
jgi:hypothetical protein